MGIGRPHGTTAEKIWRTALVRAVNRRTNGKGSPKYLERLAVAAVTRGCEGDVSAIREIGDRLDGKAVQAVELG